MVCPLGLLHVNWDGAYVRNYRIIVILAMQGEHKKHFLFLLARFEGKTKLSMYCVNRLTQAEYMFSAGIKCFCVHSLTLRQEHVWLFIYNVRLILSFFSLLQLFLILSLRRYHSFHQQCQETPIHQNLFCPSVSW